MTPKTPYPRTLDWAERLREQYRPKPRRTRVIFVAESRPATDGGERRFFYSSLLSYDNLFRGLMPALYGADTVDLSGRKAFWLERFQGDGFWLWDVVQHPINRLRPAERRRALREYSSEAVNVILREAQLSGVVVCHAGTYRVVAGLFRDSGITVLHNEAIPFPLGNYRTEFVTSVRRALAAAGINTPIRMAADRGFQ